jgi:hypothetical protein
VKLTGKPRPIAAEAVTRRRRANFPE